MRLFSSVVLISANRRAVSEVTPSTAGAGACPLCCFAKAPALGASGNNIPHVMVFQLPQLGQRPIQRGLVFAAVGADVNKFLSFGFYFMVHFPAKNAAGKAALQFHCSVLVYHILWLRQTKTECGKLKQNNEIERRFSSGVFAGSAP